MHDITAKNSRFRITVRIPVVVQTSAFVYAPNKRRALAAFRKDVQNSTWAKSSKIRSTVLPATFDRSDVYYYADVSHDEMKIVDCADMWAAWEAEKPRRRKKTRKKNTTTKASTKKSTKKKNTTTQASTKKSTKKKNTTTQDGKTKGGEST